MATSHVGVELDGTRATVVDVVEGYAVSATTIVAETAEDALKSVLSGYKPNVPVRLSLVAHGTNVRGIDVTSACLDREGFLEQAYRAIPVDRSETTAAGLFFADLSEIAEGALARGAAVVVPATPVNEAYEVMGKRPSEIVTPAFTLQGFDGLHLAFRWSNADLTLVSKGNPVAHRQLRVGGLATVERVVGPGRLETLLAGVGAPDAAVSEALERHLEVLVAEVLQTVEHWNKSGETISDSVILMGAGADIPALARHLHAAGLGIGRNDNLTRLMANLPLNERAQAMGAFLAGRSLGTNMPEVAFHDPHAQARREQAVANKSRSKRMGIMALVAAGVAAVFLGPVAAGKANVSSAEDDLLAAQDRLAAVQTQSDRLREMEVIRKSYDETATSEPVWSKVMAQVYTSVPAGAQIDTINFRASGLNVKVDVTSRLMGASSDVTAYGEITSWMQRLSDSGAKQIFPASFNYVRDPNDASKNTATSTISFEIPTKELRDEDRVLPADVLTPTDTPSASASDEVN